jgi:polysaccharide biosynthesis transport protein
MKSSETNSKQIALPTGPAVGVGESTVIHSNFMVPAAVSPAGESVAHLPPALNPTPTVAQLLQALRRRWFLALGLGIVTAAAVVGVVLALIPAKYPAQVRLLIASRGDTPLFGGSSDEQDFLVYKKNMEANFRSQLVLSAALNQKTKSGKEIKDLDLIRDNGIDWLEFALKSDFLLGPEILKVVLGTDKPDEGAEVLNAIAKAFVEENNKKEYERRARRIKEYEDNLGKQEEEKNGLMVKLRGLNKSMEVPDENVQKSQLDQTMQQQMLASKAVGENKTDQIKTQQELNGARDKLQNVDQMKVPAEDIDDLFEKDTRAQDLVLAMKKVDKEIELNKKNGQASFVESQLKDLERQKKDIAKQKEDLKTQLTPEYEKTWRNAYAKEANRGILALQIHLNTLEKQEPILRGELKTLEESLKLMGSNVPLNIVNLKSKIANLEASNSEITKIINKMKAEVINPRVSVLQYAVEPKSKDYSRQVKFAGAGGFGMFFLALFGVAFLEFRSRKISDQDEVSRGLGLNLVGTLPPLPPSMRRAGADASAPQNVIWQNQLNEAVDGIRTLLLHSSRTENLRVIMITSASGGEGKTSLATQLASSLARAWRKTLLIDGDMRKPAAHQVFNVPQEPGFSEVLRNEVTANDAIKPTSLGRLWVMPAGQFDSHAVQALAQDNMRTLFEQLKQQYDFIIVDSCPVLPVADALLLGQHVDGVVFTILRDVSRVPAVHAAQQKISNLGIRTLGAVMIGAACEMGNHGYTYAKGK